MATSPFGSVGMGQFGSDKSYIDGVSPLNEALTGFKNVLTTKGIKASGLQDFLNSLGGSPAVPSSSSGVGVNPYQNTGMPASQPYAMPSSDVIANQVNAEFHPELASTLATSLYK